MREQLTNVETHFAFGKNWAEYAEKVTNTEIAEAEQGLQRLLGKSRLDGLSFLDIGCGSGIHCLAALRLGAREVLAIDLDPDSVRTTQAMLQRHAPTDSRWRTREMSAFDLNPELHGTYDIVYSWGVLHHTGAMLEAIEKAAKMTARGGYSFLRCIGEFGLMFSGVGKSAGTRRPRLLRSVAPVPCMWRCFELLVPPLAEVFRSMLRVTLPIGV